MEQIYRPIQSKGQISYLKNLGTSSLLRTVHWLGPAIANVIDINITTRGVENLLLKIKVNKAAVPDIFPNRVLQELADEIAPVLADNFNQSLSNGSIPKY